MRLATTLLVVPLSLLTLTRVAHAEPAAPLPPAPVDHGATRLRFDIGGILAFGVAPAVNGGNAAGFGPGPALDLGVQLGDQVALYLRGELGYALFAVDAATYAIGELTPISWLSIGTGMGYEAMEAGLGDTWTGPTVPLIIGFNIGSDDPGRARRVKLRLTLEGAAGPGQFQSGITDWGFHGAIGLGAAWM
jgi:hypothetical protein